jgi:hypothetical protein
MQFLREIRRGTSKSLHWAHALRIALSIFLLVGVAVHSPAQVPTSVTPPPAKAEPAAPIDPLGRKTPRSALLGLLKYETKQDFATAASIFNRLRAETLTWCSEPRNFRSCSQDSKAPPDC